MPAETDDAVHEAMSRAEAVLAASITGSASNQRIALERLREALPALYTALVPAGTTIEHAASTQAFALLARCAHRLASDPEVLPGTDLGTQVLGILCAALPVSSLAGSGT